MPERTPPGGEGTFLVEVEGALELRWTERGWEQLLCRGDVDAVLYELLHGITAAQAQSYEFRHRRPGEDSRRQWMAMQVRRLGELDPAWEERARADYAKLLAEHPFDDQLARRAERWGALMARGLPRAEAVAQAERELPSIAPTDADRRVG